MTRALTRTTHTTTHSGRVMGLAWLLAPLMALVCWLPAEARADQELAVTIKNHQFDPPEVRAKAGEKIVLKVTNADATPEEFESSSLNREQLIRPNHTVTIHLPALKPGRYEFYGEYNPKTATGRLVVE